MANASSKGLEFGGDYDRLEEGVFPGNFDWTDEQQQEASRLC
jgi:hypothetical protein